MKKIMRSISIIMSFIMMFLLVDSSFVNAVTGEDTFGYQTISVNKQEDGTKQMYLFFDENEMDNIKEVNVYLKLTTYSDLGTDTKTYNTYSLTSKNNISFYKTLESSEMREFGTYSFDKIEIIRNDNSKKVVYNSLWNSSLAGNNSEDGAFVESEFIYSEFISATFDSLSLDKTIVNIGEEQVVTFNSSIDDESVSIDEVYVVFNKTDAGEDGKQVIKASKKTDNQYEARLSFNNSLQTGSWYVSGFEVIDSLGRSAKVQNFSKSTFKVASENADITAPKLEAYELVNGNVYDGSSTSAKPQFKLTITDDISGLCDGYISLMGENGNDYQLYISNYSYSNGSYYIDLSNYMKDTTYEVLAISLKDNADNRIVYYSENYRGSYYEPAYEIRDFSNLNVKVINNNKPQANLQIVEIKNQNKLVTNRDELYFEMKYKSDIDVFFVFMVIRNEETGKTYTLNPKTTQNEDGTYTAKYSGSEAYHKELQYMASGKYHIDCVYTSYVGGSDYIYNENRENLSGNEKTYNFDKLDFTVKNSSEDITGPKIKSITLDKNVVTPGEKVKVTIKAEDPLSGVHRINLTYRFQNQSTVFYFGGTSTEVTEEIEIPTYATTGIYSVSDIFAYDVAGNCFSYVGGTVVDKDFKDILSQSTILVKSDLNEKMPPTITSNIKDGSTFVNKVQPQITTDHGTLEMELDGKKYDGSEIKSAGTHTLYIKATGVDGSITTAKFTFMVVGEVNEDTKVEEIIDQIVNSSEQNVQITVNTEEKVVSKEIFEAIKGQDKNVTFTQNDGTEWTFNGKDIKDGANISDIKISVKSAAEDKEAIAAIEGAAEDARVIHFDYHGELPGKAAVKVFVGDRNDLVGKDLTFYYYNAETKKIEKVQGPLAIDKDGFVTVEITHCSDYFLSADDDIATVADETIINLTTKSLNMNIGDTKKIISVVDNQGDNVITYSSLDEKIVSVDKEGNVKALSAGNTKVKVECNGAVAFVDVVVNSNENNNVVIVPDKDDMTVLDKETSETVEGNKVSNSDAAKTGDSYRNMGILVFVAALSAAVLVVSTKKKKDDIMSFIKAKKN